MAAQVSEAGNYANITSTTQITARGGTLIGFYVNSTSSGTLVFKDGNASTGTAMSGTITPAIGFHRFPAGYGVNGLLVTVGSTINVTIFYQPAAVGA